MKRLLLCILTMLPAMAMPALARAEGEGPEPVPEDTCIVEFALPDGATVFVDGDDYGTQRKFVYQPLKPGATYEYEFVVHYPSGEKSKHTLVMEGGRRVRLALQDPTIERPTLAIQTGHSRPITAMAFSPNGDFIATGSADGKVIVWDAATGLQVKTIAMEGIKVSPNVAMQEEFYGTTLDANLLINAYPIVNCVGFSASTEELIIGVDSDDGSFLAGLGNLIGTSYWERRQLRTGMSIKRTKCALALSTVAISADGRLVATAGSSISPKDSQGMLQEVGFRIRLSPHVGLRVQDSTSGRILYRLGGYERNFKTAAFSKDGRFLLGVTSTPVEKQERNGNADTVMISSGPDLVIIWDLQTGGEVNRVTLSNSDTTDIAVSEHGSFFATVSRNEVTVWDGRSGKGQWRCDGTKCVFCKNEKQLIVFESDGTLGLFDISTGTRLKTLEYPRIDTISALSVSPRGDFVLAACDYKGQKKRSKASSRRSHAPSLPTPKSSSRRARPPKPRAPRPKDYSDIRRTTRRPAKRGDASDVEIDRDVSGSYRDILLIDIDSWEIVRTYRTSTDSPDVIAVSPRGKHLVTGGNAWNTVSGERSVDLAEADCQRFDVAFTLDGDQLVVAAHTMIPALFGDQPSLRSIRVFDAAQGKPFLNLKPSNAVWGTYSLSSSSDGKRILSVASDGSMNLLNAITRENLDFVEPCGLLCHGTISPNGEMAAIVGNMERILWWNRKTGVQVTPNEKFRPVPRPRQKPGPGWLGLFGSTNSSSAHVEVGPDGALTVFSADKGVSLSATKDKESPALLLRSTNTNQVLREFKISAEQGIFEGNDFGFDESGSFVYAKVWSPSLDLVELASKKRRKLESGDGGTLLFQKPVFTRDGRRILTVSEVPDNPNDTSLALLDVQTGERLREYRLSAGEQVHAFCLSNDDRFILAGYDDKTAVVWDQDREEIVQVLYGHDGPIASTAFNADGTIALTASDSDGTVRLWDIATGRELLRMITVDNRKDWLVVTPEGLFDGSAGGRQKVAFRIGDGLNVVPVDRFFQDFYYPGLLAAIWRGERPMPKVRFGEQVPPTVRIISPEKGGTIGEGVVTMEVEVVDRGGGISGPWIRQNGMKVAADGETTRDGETVRQRFQLALVEGTNEIEIQAASGDGAWESEPARMVFDYQEPPKKSNLYLISVGVSDYPGDRLDLQYARTDAEAVAELFSARGPSLYEHVFRTSLRNQDATKSRILSAIRTVAAQAAPRDTVVLFLAGHGAMVDDQYYFLPGDFKIEKDHWDEAVMRSALSAAEVGQTLTTVPALKRLLVFDTGQSGVVAKKNMSRNPFAFRGAIERLARAQGGFTIAACPSTSEAHEVSDLRHGVLTYSLLAGLKATDAGPLLKQWVKPDAEDRVVRVLPWFGFADSHVRDLTQEFFGRAQPIQHSSLGVSFPVLPIPDDGNDVTPPTEATSVRVLEPRMDRKVEIGGSADKADLYLVAVGINEYADRTLNLRYARKDAEAMIDLFRRRGAAVYENTHVVPLLDQNATKEGILRALERVAEKAGPEDTLLLFVSGHGKMVGQRFYLITHEFKQGDNTIDAEVRQQCLPIDEIADALAKISAKKRLLVFDTCASGGALGLKQGAVDPLAFRGVIDKLGATQGTFAIAASAASEEAQEHDALKHGVLTYALLAGLDAVDHGPLAHRPVQMTRSDGLVDVLQWFSFASGQGPRLMDRFYGREQPIPSSGRGVSFPVLPLTDVVTPEKTNAHDSPSQNGRERLDSRLAAPKPAAPKPAPTEKTESDEPDERKTEPVPPSR